MIELLEELFIVGIIVGVIFVIYKIVKYFKYKARGVTNLQKNLADQIVGKFKDVYEEYEKTITTIGMEYFDIDKFCNEFREAFLSRQLSDDFLDQIVNNLDYYCAGQLNKLVPRKMFDNNAYLMGSLMPTGLGAYNFSKFIIDYYFNEKLITEEERDIALEELKETRSEVSKL